METSHSGCAKSGLRLGSATVGRAAGNKIMRDARNTVRRSVPKPSVGVRYSGLSSKVPGREGGSLRDDSERSSIPRAV